MKYQEKIYMANRIIESEIGSEEEKKQNAQNISNAIQENKTVKYTTNNEEMIVNAQHIMLVEYTKIKSSKEEK